MRLTQSSLAKTARYGKFTKTQPAKRKRYPHIKCQFYLLYHEITHCTSCTVFFYKSKCITSLQVFEASLGGHTMALNSLFPPIIARYLQVWPQRWHRIVSLQVQVLGCPLSGFRPRSNPGGEAPSLYSLLAFALCCFFMRLYTNYLSEFLLFDLQEKTKFLIQHKGNKA